MNPQTIDVAFSVNDSKEDGEFVILEAEKIFEHGDYPDKNFAMTADEMKAAVESFTAPAPIELEHIRTPHILAGKLGSLESVHLNPDGKTFGGRVKVKSWLDKEMGPNRNISVRFDPQTKRIKALGVVLQGRIPDARLESKRVLQAAFAADPAEYPMDGTGDWTGAGDMLEGRALFQKLNEMAQAAYDAGDEEFYNSSYFDSLQTVIDATATSDTAEEGDVTMSADPQKPQTPPTPEPKPQPKPTEPAAFSAEFAQMKQENENLQKEMAALRKAKIEGDAAAFAKSVISDDKRALKPSLEPLTKLYTALAEPNASFSGESPLALLKAFIDTLPAHEFDKEILTNGDIRILPASFSANDEEAELKRVREDTQKWAKQRNRVPVNGAA